MWASMTVPDDFIAAGLRSLQKRRRYWELEHQAALAAGDGERASRCLQQLQSHD
jgi:hypothetical protein